MADIPQPGGTARALVAGDLSIAAAGVILLHDQFGLAGYIRQAAQRFADAGYAVVAPNLYYRSAPGASIDDSKAALHDDEVANDVVAAREFLATQMRSPDAPMVVAGLGLGARMACMVAAATQGWAALLAFYPAGLTVVRGNPTPPLARAGGIDCPTLALVGEEDRLAVPEEVAALCAEIAANDVAARALFFPQAGHAFVNDTLPAYYKPEQSDAAWSAALTFLEQATAELVTR